MPVRAPADKRFRRAHVRPARKPRLWTGHGSQIARAAALLAMLFYGAYRVVSLALSAEALHVSRITVSGTARLSRGEVVALLDGLTGESLVTVDLEGWREKLMRSPWVADAALRRVFPSTIAVAIFERQPMGIGRIGGELYLIDRRGSIIDQFGPNYADFDLPIIDGLAGPPRDGSPLIDEARAELAARLLEALDRRPDIAKRISQIDVSDRRDAVVILKSDTAFVRVGDEQFVERIQSYIDLAPTLREKVPDIDYVDLRFDERVYVRPQGSQRRGQGSQGMGQGSGGKSRRSGGRGQGWAGARDQA